MAMNIQRVMVAGSGVLGSQIAFQTAYRGYSAVVYDIDDEALQKGRNRMEELAARYERDLGASPASLAEAHGRVSFLSDLAQAVEYADLVIEAIPEILSIKKAFYQRLGQMAPEHTIFATNSSTLVPSQMAVATGRPDRFVALHFANEIWKHNTAEVMPHADTSPAVFDAVVAFAKCIGMVTLPIHKEQPGYILNSLLVPLLDAAQKLWFNGAADVETIDKTWMVATGAPQGPFAILDVVGLNTVYNIAMAKAEASGNPLYGQIAERLKHDFIDQGKMGLQSGEGFYRYPHPAFRDPNFTKE